MSNTKHTPGPWQVEHGDNYITDTGTIVICQMYLHRSDEENVANASLIAAAPELLEALQALLPMFADWHAEFPEHVGDKEAPALAAARAAIAKATGSAA